MPKNNRYLVNLSPLMEIVLKTYIAIVISLLLAACSGTPCDLSSFDKVVYEPVHAKGFRILGTEAGSTLIISENPWQGASKVSKMLMILRSGESKPEGFEGQVISGDAARIICMSSSHVAMLGCAGAAGKVVGVSGLGYLYDENVREGEVAEDIHGFVRQLFQQLVTILFVKFHQDVGSLVAIHQQVKVDRLLQGEFLIEFSDIGRIEVVNQGLCLGIIFLFDDVLQLLNIIFRQFNHLLLHFRVMIRWSGVKTYRTLSS